jgi:UDP-2,3-diacylglucosamine pyrophosphatase LpxH
MPARKDLIEWSAKEMKRLGELCAQGMSARHVANVLNKEYHKGKRVRSDGATAMKRTHLGIKVGEKPKAKVESIVATEQTVEATSGPDGIEARANGGRIKTVDDLLRHIEADMTRFEIEKSEATKYEVATKDVTTGEVKTTELHRVFVRLKPKAGPSVVEVVTALVSGAFAKRKPISYGVSRKSGSDSKTLQALVLADPHIGKYAWGRETGWEDYDIAIATKLIRESVAELLETNLAVERRALWCLGDLLHYDTPHGTTTKGTPLDRDGRVEKMLEEAVATLCDVISEMASRGPVDVVLVPGNHDAVMTVALRQILTAEFRRARNVTIDSRKTTRKYVTYGKCLLGLAHGDKAKKRLHELMAIEAREEWGASLYREIHTGHLHSMAEVATVSGVVVRTHPALCPPDGWHALEGYVGATRGMQSFHYHRDAGLVGMAMVNPEMRRTNGK